MKEEEISINEAGWLRAKITLLEFPKNCCKCSQATEFTREYYGGMKFWWLFRLIGIEWYVEIPIPTCENCNHAIKKAKKKGTLIGLLIGAIIGIAGFIGGVAISVLQRNSLPDGAADIGIIIGGTTFVLGLIGGPLIGYFWAEARNVTVKINKYSPLSKAVSIKFDDAEYAKKVFERTKQ